MIRGIHKVSTLLVLAIGVIHTVGTFFFFSSLSESAIWFAVAGLGGIFPCSTWAYGSQTPLCCRSARQQQPTSSFSSGWWPVSRPLRGRRRWSWVELGQPW